MPLLPDILYLATIVFTHIDMMQLDHYKFISGNSSLSYEFVSKGPNGDIIKTVQFNLLADNNIYNLALGDLDISTGEIDDLAVSNNRDTEKVLATVVAIIYRFLEEFPDAWIYATGSTRSRTRLYTMGLNKYSQIAEDDFHILAERNGIWENHTKGSTYNAFLVQRKL